MTARQKNSLYSLLLLLVILGVYYYRNTSSPSEEASPKDSYIQFKGETMGSYYAIQYEGKENYQEAIEVFLDTFNAHVSTYDESSILSRWNASSEEFFVLQSPYLRELIYLSDSVFNFTQGAFDPSITPALYAWGFLGKGGKRVPSQNELDSLEQLVGWQKLRIAGDSLFKPQGMQLSFNALAPGYAADKIGNWLESKGVTHYYVDVGGEIMAKGKSPRDTFWVVGIEQPKAQQAQNPAAAYISLNNAGLATSGNYRNFFKEGEQSYGHTFDPATLRPVKNEVLSATVVAGDAGFADAFATACMARGKDWALEKAKITDKLEVFLIFVNKEGELSSVWSSDLALELAENLVNN